MYVFMYIFVINLKRSVKAADSEFSYTYLIICSIHCLFNTKFCAKDSANYNHYRQ